MLFFAGVRVNEEGVPEDEENFDEAITHVNTAFMPTVVNTASLCPQILPAITCVNTGFVPTVVNLYTPCFSRLL